MSWPSPTRWHRLDAATADVLTHVQQLADGAADWRPPGGGWSARDVLEHLVITEELVLSKYPARGTPRPWREWWLVRFMTLASAGGLRVRMPLPALAPTGQVPVTAAVTRWQVARQRLRDAAALAAHAPQPVALLRHPAAGPLSWRGGLDFLAAHIRHHERQLHRIADARREAGR